jgi:hypothetical protein
MRGLWYINFIVFSLWLKMKWSCKFWNVPVVHKCAGLIRTWLSNLRSQLFNPTRFCTTFYADHTTFKFYLPRPRLTSHSHYTRSFAPLETNLKVPVMVGWPMKLDAFLPLPQTEILMVKGGHLEKTSLPMAPSMGHINFGTQYNTTVGKLAGNLFKRK